MKTLSCQCIVQVFFNFTACLLYLGSPPLRLLPYSSAKLNFSLFTATFKHIFNVKSFMFTSPSLCQQSDKVFQHTILYTNAWYIYTDLKMRRPLSRSLSLSLEIVHFLLITAPSALASIQMYCVCVCDLGD